MEQLQIARCCKVFVWPMSPKAIFLDLAGKALMQPVSRSKVTEEFIGLTSVEEYGVLEARSCMCISGCRVEDKKLCGNISNWIMLVCALYYASVILRLSLRKGY